MKKIIIMALLISGLITSGCGNSRISSNKSIEELQESVKNDPNNEVAHYSLAIGYISENKFTEAIVEFNEALKIDPHFSEAHHGIFCAEIAANDDLKKEIFEDENSEEYKDKVNELNMHYETAFMINPFFERKLEYLIFRKRDRAPNGYVEGRYNLFYSMFYNCYEAYVTGDHKQALKILNHMINEVPSNPDEEDIMKRVAKSYKTPYEKFLNNYKRTAYRLRGLTYGFVKDYDNAIKDLTVSIDSTESRNKNGILPVYLNTADLRYYIAHCYLDQNKFQEAENAFKETLTEDYSIYMAHFYLAEIYHKQNKDKEAIEEMNAALLIAPDDPMMHYNKAGFLYDMKRYNEALVEYEKTVKLNPKNYRAQYNAAIIYEMMDNKQKAEEYYRGFIDSAPLKEEALIVKVKEMLNPLKSN